LVAKSRTKVSLLGKHEYVASSASVTPTVASIAHSAKAVDELLMLWK